MRLSLIIDTNTYAGGVERALLAATTGVLSEYPTSEARGEANTYNGPDMGDVVGYMVIDSDAPYEDRCTICITPGWSDDGHGNHYAVSPTWPAKFPAYLSVQIPLNERMSNDMLEGVKRRAHAFAARKGIKVTGFRYVQERVESLSEDV